MSSNSELKALLLEIKEEIKNIDQKIEIFTAKVITDISKKLDENLREDKERAKAPSASSKRYTFPNFNVGNESLGQSKDPKSIAWTFKSTKNEKSLEWPIKEIKHKDAIEDTKTE